MSFNTRTGVHRYMPNLTCQCNPQVHQLVARYAAPDVVLDMGAGGRRLAPHVQTVDLLQTGDTDIVSSVFDVPLGDDSADLIVATGLIEHLENDLPFLTEAHRLLKDGGCLHIEVPFLQQYHDDPIDSRRYTVEGLERLLIQNGFEPQDSGFHIGPSVTIATLNAYYAGLLFEGESLISKVLSNALFLVVSVLLWPLKFLDYFLKHKKSAHRLAFGVYCTAICRDKSANV